MVVQSAALSVARSDTGEIRIIAPPLRGAIIYFGGQLFSSWGTLIFILRSTIGIWGCTKFLGGTYFCLGGHLFSSGGPPKSVILGRFTLRNRDLGCQKNVFFAPAARPKITQITDLPLEIAVFGPQTLFFLGRRRQPDPILSQI